MDVLTFTTFSMPSTSPQKAETSGGEYKKKVNGSDEPSICMRVWEAVKSFFAALYSYTASGLYFLSCKLIDIRPATTFTLPLQGEKGFHALCEVPKDPKGIEDLKNHLRLQLTECLQEHWQHPLSYKFLHKNIEPFMRVVYQVVTEAVSKGSTPVEYKFVPVENSYNFTLEFYVAKGAKKLPVWKKSDFSGMCDAFQPAEKWNVTKVKTKQGGITCQKYTFSAKQVLNESTSSEEKRLEDENQRVLDQLRTLAPLLDTVRYYTHLDQKVTTGDIDGEIQKLRTHIAQIKKSLATIPKLKQVEKERE